MTSEEKYYLDSLIKEALTVTTDEIEGQQVIDLDDLNLCAVDYATTDVDSDSDTDISDTSLLSQIYADNDFIKLIVTDPKDLPEVIQDIKTGNKTIIEFADATIKDPNPVTYSFNIQPGESINNDTIIGSVMQDGKIKQIKSIFSKATVLGNENNTDYYRLYPSRCNRHYILDDTLSGSGSDFDISDKLTEITDKFTKEGILYALITNNLCQSLLPYTLSHRYRGVYTRDRYRGYGNWYLDSSDANYNQLDISTYVEAKGFKDNRRYDTSLFVYDTVNEKLPTGVTVYNSSIMKVLDDIQDEFGSAIIGSDITAADMKSWKRRAKKKRKRKRVKQEIKEKTQNSVNKIKHSESPYNAIQDESNRLLGARNNYIDKVLALYKNKENLPLCKYDPSYTDCKFLVNNSIDKNVLENAQSYDSEFSYSAIGDVDNYYNYYYSLLGNINLTSDDEYTKEYYQLITDIINKRLIVESIDAKDMKYNFMKLFNDNVSPIFTLYTRNNTEQHLNIEFSKFEKLVNVYTQKKQKEDNDNLNAKLSEYNLDDEAMSYATSSQTSYTKYQQVYNYISSLYTFNSDEDSDAPNEIVSQLATMYTYILSYGDGKNNVYKDMKTSDDKYLYLGLVQEEAKKIIDFWDKIIALYEECTMDNCIKSINELSESFDEYATWPIPQEITIDNITYNHYLFENIYPKDTSSDIEIKIGDYSFPESIEFPDIPDELDPIDELDALNELNNHEQQEPDDANAITFLDTEYWQKYFALATLICLVPTYWNCGLDIMPFIQMIPLPCIFVCIKAVYIPMFNLLMVFGIAIRGMYPWPIILYLNTSDQPISILTPLIAVLDQLKETFYKKINNIETTSVQTLVNQYIKKLNNEINEIKKENIKLDNFKRVIKGMKIPKVTSIQEEFAKVVDPSIDTRQRIQRIETLIKKNRVS